MLAHSGSEARTDAQFLLARALGRNREWLIAHGESFVDSGQVENYLGLCKRRASGMPIAYITGYAGFYKREFVVNEHVMIPRPETEHLVEDAIAHLRGRMNVFEAGVGSGAIACTIAAEVPGARIEGTDVSAEAIATAELNAQRLNVQAQCTFYVADVVRARDERTYDVVIANLPYIPTEKVPRKPDPVGFEPRMALDGGPDGLDQYRKLLGAVPNRLRPGALLLMEAAPGTVQALQALTMRALPGARAEVRRDYAGLERYVYVKTH